MAIVILDLDAIEDAQARLRHVADGIASEVARQNYLSSRVDSTLQSLGSAILSQLNPANWFDPTGPWDQSGLGGLLGECQASHDIVRDGHAVVNGVVQALRETHGDDVGGFLESRAWDMISGLGSALDSFGGVFDIFHPGNLLSLLRDPWTLVSRIGDVRGFLSNAGNAIESYLGFLSGIQQRAEDVLTTIMTALHPEISFAQDVIQYVRRNAQGIETVLHDVSDGATALAPVLAAIPGVGETLSHIDNIVGVVSGDLSSGKFDGRTLTIDGYAEAIDLALSAVTADVSSLVFAAFSAAALSARGIAAMLREDASRASGPERQALERLAKQWETEADRLDAINNLEGDAGAMALDGGRADLSNPELAALSYVYGDPSKLGSDAKTLASDAGSALEGAGLFGPLLAETQAVTLTYNLSAADQAFLGNAAPAWVTTGLGDAKSFVNQLTAIGG